MSRNPALLEGNKEQVDKSEGGREPPMGGGGIQLWLNQDPTAPFTCPLLWIPTPFGIRVGGNPTAIGGGAVGYSP